MDKEYEEYHNRWYVKIIDWLEENIWWKIERIWEWPREQFSELKWFFQRGKRGWSDSDLWSLDGYLSSWLPAALKQLKEYKHSYPCNLTEKKWDKILDQMIEAFKIDDKIGLMEYKEKEYKKLDKIRRKGLELFIEHYSDLWD